MVIQIKNNIWNTLKTEIIKNIETYTPSTYKSNSYEYSIDEVISPIRDRLFNIEFLGFEDNDFQNCSLNSVMGEIIIKIYYTGKKDIVDAQIKALQDRKDIKAALYSPLNFSDGSHGRLIFEGCAPEREGDIIINEFTFKTYINEVV